MNVWQWAEKYRRLSRDVTPKPGRYRVNSAPFQKEPQEAFEDPVVQTTVLRFASRLGKTEMINNLHGKKIHNDPQGILVCYPTLDSAKKWSKEFFMPMVRATPVIKRLVRERKSRDANNTILLKFFPGGKISAIGANSPSGFRQIQAPVVTCDEIDAMENSVEGDPVTLAFKRADNYPNSIQVVSSTPTIKNASRIDAFWEISDKRLWFCPCPKCGVHQVLKWAQVKWTFKGPDGKDESRPEEAYYECENSQCKAQLNDEARVAMVKAGHWRATAPFKGVRGYMLNGINTTFSAKKGYKTKLHQMVAEFLEANRKGKHALKTWINTFLAECYEEEAERVEGSVLLKRREKYGPKLPNKVLVLTAGVDVQGDRLEIFVAGWGDGEEFFGVQYFILPGNPLEQQVWKDLDEFLTQRAWTREDGVELKILSACIDTGGTKGATAWAEMVYTFCKPRFAQRIFAIKGANQSGLSIAAGFSRNNRKKCPVWRIGTDTAKSQIYGRLKITEPGPAYMHFPEGEEFGFTESFFSQLTAEEIRLRIHKGFPRREWHLPEGRRNEALDACVYATAALVILQPNWKALQTKSIEAKAKVYTLKPATSDEPKREERPKVEPPKKRERPPRTPRVRGGWVGGWR